MVPKRVSIVSSVKELPCGLRQAEVDDLGHGAVVVGGDEHVRWLDVAVDDAFLMGVLDRLANRHEELQTLAEREPLLVAILGDRRPLDQFHHEKRTPRGRAARVQHAGDIGVVHHGQCLPLGLEAGQDGLGVHAGLDDLDGDGPLHRLGLLGQEDAAHASFANPLQDLVTAGDHLRRLCRVFRLDGDEFHGLVFGTRWGARRCGPPAFRWTRCRKTDVVPAFPVEQC